MEACSEVCDVTQTESGNGGDIQAYILKAVSYNIPCKQVLALLHVQGVQFDSFASLSKLRKVLHCHARTLQKGKHVPVRSAHQEECHGTKDVVREARLNGTCNRWLQVIPQSLKAKISQMFQEETSSDALREKMCASCAESVPADKCEVLPTNSLNLELLKRPDDGVSEVEAEDVNFCYTNPDCVSLEFHSFDGIDKGVMLEPASVLSTDDEEEVYLQICRHCSCSLAQNKLPQFVIANQMFLGNCPLELQNLMFIEESIISLCRAKLYLIQLRADKANDDIVPPNMQRGLCGHVIVYPQSPQTVTKKLLPKINNIITPVCVLFIGSQPPT